MFRIPLQFTSVNPFAKYIWNHRIAHKIALGYMVAIGIAVVGTSAGLLVGSIAERRALGQYRAAQQQMHTIHELENRVMVLLAHPQSLLAAADDALWWEYEIGKYRANEAKLTRSLQELQQAGDLDTQGNRVLKASGVLTVLPKFLAEYTIWSRELWPLIEHRPEQIAADFSTRMTSNEWSVLQVQFERLSEDLLQVRRQAETRSRDALV